MAGRDALPGPGRGMRFGICLLAFQPGEPGTQGPRKRGGGIPPYVSTLNSNGVFMCNYSLHATNNRLAVEGEELFVHRFYMGSKGMASKSDLAALRSWQPAPAGSSFWGKVFHHI